MNKKLSVLAKTGGVCAYCAAPLTLTTMTLNHVVPTSKGGGNCLR